MDCFLFKDLSDEDAKNALSFFTEKSDFGCGDELYKIGFLGLVLSGTAVIKRNSTTGQTAVRNICEGDIFGCVSLFGEWKNNLSSIIALKAGSVLYINEADFKRLLLKFPQVSLRYIAFLSDRLRFLNSKLDIFSASSTHKKVYEYLCSVSNSAGYAKPQLSMSELAKRLKIGRSSLYRDIEHLISLGLIAREGKMFKINKF